MTGCAFDHFQEFGICTLEFFISQPIYFTVGGGQSLDEGQDEFLGEGYQVGYVCRVLSDPG